MDHSNIVSINSTSQPQLSSNHSWIASGMAQHHINGFTSKDLAVGCKLEIGDRVGVMINNKEFKGEVRWLGLLPDAGNSDAEVAGLEMVLIMFGTTSVHILNFRK